MVGGGEVGRVQGVVGGVHEVQVVEGGELMVVTAVYIVQVVQVVHIVQVSAQITNFQCFSINNSKVKYILK